MPLSLSLIAVFLTFCLPTISQAKGWRGIVPLKSTRADVERLLGLPGKHGRYQFNEERAYINYAGAGPCNTVNGCLCLVPADTVISIYVELEVEVKFSRLNINKKKYEKLTSPENLAIATYSSDGEGIIYTVDQAHDEVIAIEFLPTAKDCKDVMRSSRSSKLAPQSAKPMFVQGHCLTNVHVGAQRRSATIPRTVDAEYSDTVKAELDLLAQEAGKVDRIIMIARRGTGERQRGLERRRLDVARRYLRDVREVEEQRLVLAVGEKMRGPGIIEAYLRGKLFLIFQFKRDKNFAPEF